MADATETLDAVHNLITQTDKKLSSVSCVLALGNNTRVMGDISVKRLLYCVSFYLVLYD